MSLTASESINFTYNVGFSSTHTTESQSTAEYQLNYEMSAGMTMKIPLEGSIEESFKLSAGYSASIMEDTQTSMTKDVSVEWPITCS